MSQVINNRRRVARDVGRAGAALSATMLLFSAAAVLGGGSVSAAPQNAGALQVLVPPGSPTAGQPLVAGGSDTPFALTPPAGAACTGDSATAGYRISTYMVPSSVDPATLTFNASGPILAGSGAAYRQPLFTSAGSSWVNKLTGIAPTAGGGGLLIGLNAMSFGFIGELGTAFLPAGTYNIGYACTLGPASATQLDKYWNAQITVVADAADVPSGLTWTAVAASVVTTTTSTTIATTTTVAGATTTTTLRPTATTTTTVAGSSTTSTIAGATTTTSTIAGATTTSIGFGSASPTPTTPSPTAPSFSSSGTIPRTGASPVPFVVWAVLLLVFGRMAVLFARPARVLPPTQR